MDNGDVGGRRKPRFQQGMTGKTCASYQSLAVLPTDGHPNAPADVPAYNPAFDATPMSPVDYLVTERGVFEPPLSRRTVAGR